MIIIITIIIITFFFHSQARPFTLRGASGIATVYKKVLYREYTDGTFTHEKPHPAHLGVLGPVIKGEVGDVIKIHFMNKANRNFSVHSHGVFYVKGDEGALYADHTIEDQKRDDMVKPGDIHHYTWIVNEEHGPAKADDDCVTLMYHSHVMSMEDTNTGLIGISGRGGRGTQSSA